MEPMIFFSVLYVMILAAGISLGVFRAKGPELLFAQTDDTIQPGASGNMTNKERQAQADEVQSYASQGIQPGVSGNMTNAQRQAEEDALEESEGIQPGTSGNQTTTENNAAWPNDPVPLADAPQQISQEPSPSQAIPGSEPFDSSTGRPVITQPIPYRFPDFSDRSDFRAESLPTEDIITYQSSFLNPGEVAELKFLVEPGWVAVLRVVPEGRELNLNGFENAFQEQVRHVQTDGKDVLLFNNPNGAALALWSKNGFDYALYFEKTEMGLFAGSADTFVKQTNFVMTE